MMDELLETEGLVISSGDEDVRQYLSEIRRYPRLTPQEEQELARRCAEGDEEAIRVMVSSNLRLVVSVAREYAGRGVPLLDLIQEGSIGLIVAAKKFDYTLDFRFSTYATKWIRQRIGRYLLERAEAIRVPAHTAERMRKLRSAQNALRVETGREPTVPELAQRAGIPADKAAKLLVRMPEVSSLDVPLGDSGEDTVGTLLPAGEELEPQAELIRRELRELLEGLLELLNERQRQVLRLHFGMEDGTCHTLEEIGKTLGISKERARQIKTQALDKLRQRGADLGLEDFLE